MLAIAAVFVSVLVPSVADAAPVNAAQSSSSVVASTTAGAATTAIRPATLDGWNAGNIISDAVFTDKSTMSAQQIQDFFNAKVPSCQSGYTCLKDFRVTSQNRPADAYCSGYSGTANESAASIIYRVSQSCNINPRVLIVMLQKEQGLVTHTWPSGWRYDSALGQGCPDDAPCDPSYVGFFQQIYGAARQMQIYMEGRWFTWYQPGNTWNVLYNPNQGCGSGPVYIANKATAALYYYTPYQPNAAALRAGYGEGDSCSAYGNRNFYNYFTDWFGSTQGELARATTAIDAEYQAQGGAAGLGAPASGMLRISANGGGYGKAYAGGSIYWNSAVGAKTVRVGVYRDLYFAADGANGWLGWPITNVLTLADGTAQAFTGGSIYSGPAGAFVVSGAVRDAYFAQGGATGPYGWPTSGFTCAGTFCQQVFSGGAVLLSGDTTSNVMEPFMSAYWAAGGRLGGWGFPSSGLIRLASGGQAQIFAGGSVYALPGAKAGAAYLVGGPIRDEYFRWNGADGKLGYPLGSQSCTPALCQQEFEHGWILWSSADGARIGAPEIDAAYAASATILGARIPSSFFWYSYGGGGMAELFANGSIFFKRGVGAFAVSGRVRDGYFAAGGAAGRYGWPTGAMSCASGTCTQTFEGGTITAAG